MPKIKRPVYCKELDKTFPSIQETAWELDLSIKCVWRCCHGLQRKTKGYHLSFAKEEKKNER